MEVEIVFTGLSSFLNVNGKNPTMTEPSVILVRTDGHAGMEMGSMHQRPDPAPGALSKSLSSVVSDNAGTSTHGHDKHATLQEVTPGPIEGPPMLPHIAFLAYDTKTTKVTAEPPDMPFKDVEMAQSFRFLPLDGVQLEIENDLPGTPNLPDNTYRDLVVRKDDYWPEARNEWNRDYVPEPGTGRKPKKSAVAAYLRFGSGNIMAGKVCPFPWRFAKPDGTFLENNYAEEVVYSGFSHSGDDVVITLTDLDTSQTRCKLRFSPLANGVETLSLHVGNNTSLDMARAVKRLTPDGIQPGTHFLFLNKIAAPALTKKFNGGPFAIPQPRTIPAVPGEDGSGSDGGPCGPDNGNGAPPP